MAKVFSVRTSLGSEWALRVEQHSPWEHRARALPPGADANDPRAWWDLRGAQSTPGAVNVAVGIINERLGHTGYVCEVRELAEAA